MFNGKCLCSNRFTPEQTKPYPSLGIDKLRAAIASKQANNGNLAPLIDVKLNTQTTREEDWAKAEATCEELQLKEQFKKRMTLTRVLQSFR